MMVFPRVFSFVQFASVLLGALALGSIASLAQEKVTFSSLLEEMTDRGALARFPDPAYGLHQASSYDRASISADKPGWFANDDRNQFVREEMRNGRKEKVLMDASGPGAIVRFWVTMAGPGAGQGTLRIYLDGADVPVIEGNIFALISGGLLAEEPLSQSVSPLSPLKERGHNLYLPIPYAKSCLVTFEQKADCVLYYQINHRQYAPGTVVETYSPQAKSDARKLLARTQFDLASSAAPSSGTEEKSFDRVLQPGESVEVELAGPGAIRQLLLNLKAGDLQQALRSTVLVAEFDGEPAIWAPVGDFFGTGYQLHPYRSWFNEVTMDGTMRAYWMMPYERSARIVVQNLGVQPVELAMAKVVAGPWKWDDRSLHFHASWRQYYTAKTKKEDGIDLNFVSLEGRGRYVGDTLTLFNAGGPGKTVQQWWGEGDEKIYVDGEGFPSNIGTGTEDYYGYAWCRPEQFEAPFHAQPSGGGNYTPGFTVNSRWRALDAIPFERSLRFDMELWHWSKTLVNYSPTTFWYGRPGARSNVPPSPEEAARPVFRNKEELLKLNTQAGLIEAESFLIAEVTEGKADVQEVHPKIEWSGTGQIWWRGAQPGARLVLKVPVSKEGLYAVSGMFTYAPDYGIVTISINGVQVIKDLNLYSSRLKTGKVDLGSVKFRAGENDFEILMESTDPDAEPKYMFGVDYLTLTPLGS